MKIEIKEPCHEDWNNMKIGMMSRHCAVCVKNVVDFTTMNRAEIITYLLSNQDESVCGRMRPDQFDFRHEDIPILVEVLKTKPRNHAFLILALVSLSLSSCAQENTHNENPIQTEHPELIMGKVAPEPKPDTTTVRPGTCNPEIETLGEIAIQGNIAPVKGDVSYEIQEVNELTDPKILQFSEKMPEYKGGVDALFNYVNTYFSTKKIASNTNYYVRFVVNEDGKTSDPEIINSPDNFIKIHNEIKKMVLEMPKWIPGEQDGKKVSVYYTIPVRFK